MEASKKLYILLGMALSADYPAPLSDRDTQTMAEYYRSATDLEKALIDSAYPLIKDRATELATRTVRVRLSAKAYVETYVTITVNDDVETFEEAEAKAIALANSGDVVWSYNGILDETIEVQDMTDV